MQIFVFGNPLVEEDRTAVTLAVQLSGIFPNIRFMQTDPNENFPPPGQRDLIILDVVRGIEKVTLLDFSDLAFVGKSPVSPHDYDLLLHLLLLKKMGKIDGVRIIGIPYGKKDRGMLEEIKKIIKELSEKGA